MKPSSVFNLQSSILNHRSLILNPQSTFHMIYILDLQHFYRECRKKLNTHFEDKFLRKFDGENKPQGKNTIWWTMVRSDVCKCNSSASDQLWECCNETCPSSLKYLSEVSVPSIFPTHRLDPRQLRIYKNKKACFAQFQLAEFNEVREESCNCISND